MAMNEFHRYWGKTQGEADYHLLVYHCMDVAAVGHVLAERHSGLRRRLSNTLNLSEAVFHQWMLFFLSLHDLGKFAEAFQRLNPTLYQKLQEKEGHRQYSQRHDTLGYMAWKHLLKKFGQKAFFNTSLQPDIPEYWIQTVTGHHGEPPGYMESGNRRIDVADYFSEDDLNAAFSFIQEMRNLFLSDPEVFHGFEDKSFPKRLKQISWWLAGISVVCDWIGSDTAFFKPHQTPMKAEEYWKNHALLNAEKAVNSSGIIPAKKAAYSGIGHLFDYIDAPSPLQEFCHGTRLPQGPQLWILEDITGSGKTEAALILAHRLMSGDSGEGVFIGLPTMATANAMYERMAKCYENLYAENQKPSLILAHSARHLSKTFSQSILPRHFEFTSYDKKEPTGSAQCSAWIADHRKKAMLADVGIGTADQAMLGILPVRHQSMRLLGLAFKILIIDEIHAYDVYMSQLIRTLLTFHAKIGGSVILLSATLPRKMRGELINSFLAGLGGIKADAALTEDRYPLVTSVTGETVEEFQVAPRAQVSRKVHVRMVHDERQIYELIRQAEAQARCLCWIRNTVADARSAYRELRARYNIPAEKIGLFHARFTLSDRLNIEEKVIENFGKGSDARQRKGRILIATQVVEQSLDLDFDVLISDLAPIDLIIQRAGRLCRHVRDRLGNRICKPGAVDERDIPVFYVLGPEPLAGIHEDWYRSFFPRANMVYPHTGNLWRTARLLSQFGQIRMPEDARPFIEGVYGENAEDFPESLEEASQMAEGESVAKKDIALRNRLKPESGYSRKGCQAWDEDIRIPTRLGENTVMLHLARYENGSLTPLAEGDYPWDLSSLRVYESKLCGISQDTPDELKLRLDQLKESEKRLNPYSVVLPMVPCGDGEWQAEGQNANGKTVPVVYSRTMGLLIDDE